MMSFPSNFSLNVYNSSIATHSGTPLGILRIPDDQRIIFTVLYAVILILSVVGNTSIIAVVARNPSMRSTINYLIANMAATDLASSVVVTSYFFSAIHNLSWEWQVPGLLGDIFCRLCPYIHDVSIAVSTISMVAIAFDRFFAVVYPMRATPRVLDIRVVLPVVWLVPLGAFSVHWIKHKLVSIQGVHLCLVRWPSGIDQLKAETIFYLSILSVFWLIPLTTIAVLYAIIALKMRRQTIPGQQTSEIEEARRKLNNSIVKMSFAIVFFFFLFWFPYHVFIIMRLFVWKGKLPKSVQPYHSQILILISDLSFVINPFICFTFSFNYRKYIKNLFLSFSVFSTNRVGPSDAPALSTPVNRESQTAMVNLKKLNPDLDNPGLDGGNQS